MLNARVYFYNSIAAILTQALIDAYVIKHDFSRQANMENIHHHPACIVFRAKNKIGENESGQNLG